MSVLLATAAGRVALLRSMRWSAIVGVVSIAIAMTWVVQAATDGNSDGLIVDAALMMVASSFAFAVDEVAGSVVAATPVGLRPRLLARLLATSPVIGLGWWAVMATAGRSVAGDGALVGVGIAALAVASAVWADRLAKPTSPGSVGVAITTAGLSVAALGAPTTWIDALPSARVGWFAAAAAAAAVVAATREPTAS